MDALSGLGPRLTRGDPAPVPFLSTVALASSTWNWMQSSLTWQPLWYRQDESNAELCGASAVGPGLQSRQQPKASHSSQGLRGCTETPYLSADQIKVLHSPAGRGSFINGWKTVGEPGHLHQACRDHRLPGTCRKHVWPTKGAVPVFTTQKKEFLKRKP